jgi:hypothetical protein
VSGAAGTASTYALDRQARQAGWSGITQGAALGAAGGLGGLVAGRLAAVALDRLGSATSAATTDSIDPLVRNTAALTGRSDGEIARALQHFQVDEHTLVDAAGNLYRGRFDPYPRDVALLQKVAAGDVLSDNEGTYLKQLITHEHAEAQFLDTHGTDLEREFNTGLASDPPQNALAERLRAVLLQQPADKYGEWTDARVSNLLDGKREPIPMTPYRFAHIMIGLDYPNPDETLIEHLAPAE